jgi:MFS family permease
VPASSPELARAFGVSGAAAAAIALAAPLLLATAIEPPLLLMADRAPDRRPWMRAGLLAMAASCALAAVAPNLWILGAAMVLLGPSVGLACCVAEVALIELSPERAEQRLTRAALLGVVGDIGAPALLAAAVAIGGTWRGALLGVALATLAVVPLVPALPGRGGAPAGSPPPAPAGSPPAGSPPPAPAGSPPPAPAGSPPPAPAGSPPPAPAGSPPPAPAGSPPPAPAGSPPSSPAGSPPPSPAGSPPPSPAGSPPPAPAGSPPPAPAGSPPPAPAGSRVRRWRAALAALADRRLLVWIAGALLCSLLDEIFVAFAALHIAERFGADPTARPLVLGAFLAGGAAGLVAQERLLARMAPRRLLAAIAAVCASAYLAWIAAPSLAVSAALAAVVGLTCAGQHPLAMAQAYRAAPGRAGAIKALQSLLTPLEVVLPLALAALAQSVGVTAVLLTLAAQPLGLLAIAVLAPADRAPDGSDGEGVAT